MTAVQTLWGPGSLPSSGSFIQTQHQLNDADNAIATLYYARKGGSIDQIAYNLQGETGVSPAYKVGITTVDASGNPTQTDFAASSTQNNTHTATGDQLVTLSTPCPIAQGDLFAAHIFPGATPPDGSNFISVRYSSIRGGTEPYGMPKNKVFSTSWSNLAYDMPAIACRLTTGEWLFPNAYNSELTNYTSSSTPDEYGAYFTVPMAFTVCGLRLMVDPPAATNSWVATLYSAADAVLATQTVDADIEAGRVFFDIFFADVTLQPDVAYRIGITNSSAASNMNVPMVLINPNTAYNGFPGATFRKTSRTDAGAWTEDGSRVPLFALWISDIPAGGAGGGTLGNVSRPGALGYSRGY